jgi:hypothetical protein
LLVCVYFFLSCVHAIFVCMCVCELIQKEERFCSSRIVFRLIRYRTIGRVFCYGTVLLIIIFLDSIHFACFLLLTDYALYTHTAYFFLLDLLFYFWTQRALISRRWMPSVAQIIGAGVFPKTRAQLFGQPP